MNIKGRKKQEFEDWWNELSTEQQKSVEISLKQIENGEYVTHEEAMRGLRERYDLLD